MLSNFLHYFSNISLQHIRSTAKNMKQNLLFIENKIWWFLGSKMAIFWKIAANFKISHNNLLSAYYCVKCYQNCCVTNCNAVIQHIQRGAQNFNGKILFKAKINRSFFLNTLYMDILINLKSELWLQTKGLGALLINE